jgi:hypothetical protein
MRRLPGKLLTKFKGTTCFVNEVKSCQGFPQKFLGVTYFLKIIKLKKWDGPFCFNFIDEFVEDRWRPNNVVMPFYGCLWSVMRWRFTSNKGSRRPLALSEVNYLFSFSFHSYICSSNLIKILYINSGTPVTRPTMGPMSYGHVVGVVASVKLKICGWISRPKNAYRSSIACLF